MAYIKIKLIKSKLTNREQQVVKLICEGNTNINIGKKLGISFFTVDFHRRNIYSKIKSRTTASVVKYGIKTGIYKFK